MATPADEIKQSDLLNQLVLDRNTLDELGHVEVLWLYPQSHRVLGFISKSGFLGTKKAAFKLNQVDALGANGVLTHAQPEETDGDKVSQLDSLIGCEIWSDAGNRIGKITDFLFNLKTGDITQYLFVSSGWSGIADDVYQLPPAKIISVGRRRVLVNEDLAHRLTVYREGLRHKLTEEYSHTAQELRSRAQQAQQQVQDRAKQVQGRLQQLAEQAKDKAQSLSQQAREQLDTLNERWETEAQTLTQQAKQRGKDLFEQMTEPRPQDTPLAQDDAPTLTVAAHEVPDLNRGKLPGTVPNEVEASTLPSSADPTADDADWIDGEEEEEDEPWI